MASRTAASRWAAGSAGMLAVVMRAAIVTAMHRRHRKTLPGLWLMTDERVADDRLLAAARALPRGRAGIILRHYRTPPAQRREAARSLTVIARGSTAMELVPCASSGTAPDVPTTRAWT